MNCKKAFVFLLVVVFCKISYAQDNLTSTINISGELKENANIVYRKNHKDINISLRNKMTISKEIYVTILNEAGWRNFELGEYYDKADKIRSIEAIVYNGFGKEIKKIRRSDFKDYSVADGFSVYTDNRMLALEYTPVQYPFTIKYTSVVETTNTAFIPQWFPVYAPFMSVEQATLSLTYPVDLGFRFKEYNFDNYAVEINRRSNTIEFKLSNFVAIKHEDYTPSLIRFAPYVRFALQKFHIEGYEGEASTWEELGNWINTSFLIQTNDLPEATKQKMRELVKDETDNRKKAAKIYKYVQDKTRYVSIQLGIGGWKPMNAQDVDRLGYGDCKALTNYTKALLEAVGIPSYYTLLHSSSTKRDVSQDFVALQGNHAILGVPDNNGVYWLECTSQTMPFGYIGGSNDDRLVLSINESEVGLKRTEVYKANHNSQISKAKYSIDNKGAISGLVEINTNGIQYGSRYFLERQSAEDRDKYYKDYFSNINNLSLKNIKFQHNPEQHSFNEAILLDAENYCDMSGNRIIFVVNAFNQYRSIPQRYRKRLTPFEISRGFSDYDEFEIEIPEGYAIEAIPNDVELETKFGKYKVEYQKKSENTIVYKRTLNTSEGYFEKELYDEFRSFREQVARNDNAKVVLVKQ